MSQPIAEFVANCRSVIARAQGPSGCVAAIAPMMRELLANPPIALEPRHVAPDPAAYARNAIHIAGDDEMSLFALVWLPGQWTPVHDHGTWGVVGVVEGILEEHVYLLEGGEAAGAAGFRLSCGGVALLPPGAVCGFIERADHIHKVGVPQGRLPCISLHMYGRNMNAYNVYDLAAGTRCRVGVTHH